MFTGRPSAGLRQDIARDLERTALGTVIEFLDRLQQIGKKSLRVMARAGAVARTVRSG
jgi:hypothetical protein